MLAEKNALTTDYGRAAFAILLFQDLIVIPLIAIMPLLGDSAAGSDFDAVQLGKSIAAVAVLIVGGRLLLRPVLEMVAKTSIPELFTATALLVVIGAALLMQVAGMSMVLGAFLAGMLLADSEYRHQLEADIAPFKGLLLGLFFIAVGMSVNLSLLLSEPLVILAIVFVLMAVKALILFLLARPFGMCNRTGAFRLAAAMSQGGEFAFVLFALATSAGALAEPLAATLTLAVTLSMLLTPIIFAVAERLTHGKEDREQRPFDEIEEQESDILIAGFGRVGQIVGRMLRASGRQFTALEYDTDQVNLVRNYGNKVHFGDARHLGVLRAAGAGEAKLLVIATGGMETSLNIAATARRHFPNLKIIARAHNRRHAHKLMELGVDHIFRDTLLSSVAMGEQVFAELGMPREETRRLAELFVERDEQLLREQFAIHDSEEKLIQTARETADEMKTLLQGDVRR
jgi:glutathione-regulated potassium-efflux system protein KefB